MKNTLISLIVLLLLGGTGYSVSQQFGASFSESKTDAEWAEDVKAENLDIKSTEVLEEMKASHTAKLQRLIETSKILFDCPECVKYEIRQNFERYSEIRNLDVMVEAEYQNQLDHYHLSIEKINQSLERMDNELRLREEGFVVPDKNREGTKTQQADLDKVDEQYQRKIND